MYACLSVCTACMCRGLQMRVEWAVQYVFCEPNPGPLQEPSLNLRAIFPAPGLYPWWIIKCPSSLPLKNFLILKFTVLYSTPVSLLSPGQHPWDKQLKGRKVYLGLLLLQFSFMVCSGCGDTAHCGRTTWQQNWQPHHDRKWRRQKGVGSYCPLQVHILTDLTPFTMPFFLKDRLPPNSALIWRSSF